MIDSWLRTYKSEFNRLKLQLSALDNLHARSMSFKLRRLCSIPPKRENPLCDLLIVGLRTLGRPYSIGTTGLLISFALDEDS